MKQKGLLMLLVFALLLGVANSAGAYEVTVEDNLTDDLLISEGDSVTGQFDINPPALPDDGNYNTPYDINSAVASFTLTDDGDVAYSYSNSITTYTNWSTTSGDRYKVVRTYDYFVDENEQVVLNVGTQVSTNGTDWYQLQVLDYQSHWIDTDSYTHTYTYDCNCNTWGCDTCTGYYTTYVQTHYDTYNYDNTSGYTGELTVDIALDESNLIDLSWDGIIDFTIQGSDGDIIFNSGVLTADVSENPNANPVPEPATLLLLGAGLAGAAGYARKRKM